MRGISALYRTACGREGCLTNSLFLKFCVALDTSEDCPTEIDLHENYLGDSGSAAVLRTVAVMAWVRRLDLRSCGAGEKAVRALIEFAAEHPNLRCVDLRGCNSTVFAVSGRLLLRLLLRTSELAVLVNYDDLPPTMAKRLRSCNDSHEQNQRRCEEAERRAIMAEVDAFDSLHEEERVRNLLYLATTDRDGNALYDEGSDILHLINGLNTYMEQYVEAYAYVGRVAAQLAVDLGPDILPCIRTTAPAAPGCLSARSGLACPSGVACSVRAVDALLTGLCSNPFIREELEEHRGSILSMYINKLQTLRGEYQHVMSSRMGPFPSYKEWQLEQKMRPLYNRIVAGITQGSMEDLPSMKYVEVRLRELRLLILDKLYEGRERTLQLPLLQLRYFAYNRSVETNAWAVGYIRDARAHIHSQQIHHQHAPYTSVSGSEEEGDDQLGGGSLGDRLQEEKYESELAKRAEGESSRHNRLYLKALDDLRETISDPYTVARYSVTRPLAELLPVEFKYFLCDLVLRRAALLYTPRIFLLDEKTDETRQGQGIWGVGGEPDDPHDIVGIFQCVLGRKEFSEVLCAFEEWYRLHQVEKYDVTHVSRQELLALTTNM